MINLLCLDPVTTTTTQEEKKYIEKYLCEDTMLVVDTVKGGPASIESAYDEAYAMPWIVDSCKSAIEDGQFDGIFINCFGDPAVEAVREISNIPIFGGYSGSMYVAAALADKIGIVTIMKNVLNMLREHTAAAHLDKRIVCMRTVDIPVLELADTERLIKALVEETKKSVDEDGAQIIVLGCTGMIGVAENVEEKLHQEGYDIQILEPAQTAVKFLELNAQMRLKASSLTYLTPPQDK